MIGFPFDSQVTYDENGTPIYDRAISSAPLRQLIKSVLSNGVLPNPSTNLQVQPGTGMTVVVNPGFAVIEGGMKYEETQRTLVVQASDTVYDRIDTVVLRWNDNANARSCDFYVIKGVPASSPVRPTLNREGSVYEIGLADLFIVANSSAISAARITDTRYEAERCGIISSIAEFDSDAIYKQVQSDLSGFKEEEQAAFLAWFENIKGQLSEDAAGNLQAQIGTPSELETDEKSDLVKAVNEVNEKAKNGGKNLVGDEFSEESSYSVGDYCIYNNVLYVFTADKSAGAWNAGVVRITTVSEELSEQNKKTVHQVENLVSISSGSIGIEKVGRVVTLYTNGLQLTNAINTATIIGKVPNDLKPSNTVINVSIHSVGGKSYPCRVALTTNGEIKVEAYDWDGNYVSSKLWLTSYLTWII